MSNNTQIKVVVTGRVQGVFFRAETKRTADQLGIKGYVKNLANGSVEAVFYGNKKIVTQMVQWCHKGPTASIVEDVATQEQVATSNFTAFEIRY